MRGFMHRQGSLERHYRDAAARVETLTPSVLAKAFSGKLVPQDRNDEPTERMLERIRREGASGEEAARYQRSPAGRRSARRAKIKGGRRSRASSA